MTGDDVGSGGSPDGASASVGQRPEQYARLAVERHWDPGDVDIDADVDAVAAMDRRSFTRLRGLLAQFGAGEQRVTEALAPLALVLDGTGAQRFVATQLYDEARHASFFDRYWETIVHPVEAERGLTPTSPSDDRWTSEAYRELFDRTDQAMVALVERDGPRARARAYCHYHLAVEGILADAAYRWIEHRYGAHTEAGPKLPGLVAGIRKVRSDEGRHVAFGVTRIGDLLDRGAVDPTLVADTLDELVALIRRIVSSMAEGMPAARTSLLERVEAARAERAEQVGAVDAVEG